MVKIHKCRDCGKDIYYKPEFVHVNLGHGDGYATSFKAMNLDKTAHKCERDPAREAEDRYWDNVNRTEREYWKNYSNENYIEGYDLPR